MKIVQIRGCNGSGKTTIARGLLSLCEPDTLEELAWPLPKNRQKVFATVAPGVGWAVIGSYPEGSKMGGCDGMKTMDDIKQAILDTYQACPELFGIAFEGMMISKSKWTFYDYLLDMEQKFHIQPVFVILKATPDGCLQRIAGRGTHRAGVGPVNRQMIEEKCEVTIRYGKEFDAKYVRWIDVETTPRDAMLQKFLRQVGDDELWKQLI